MLARSIVAVISASVVGVGLVGCSTAPEADTGLSIVASTNVYGDIASTIAGDFATVTSLVSSAAQDPHSFEASVRDQLAISKADLIIENGGGYDPFIDTLLDASGNTTAAVISAARVVDLDTGANEHLWYDFAAVDELAAELAEHLAAMDPANEATYDSNYEAFAARIDGLEATADALAEQFEGTGVAITEPVPLYLLENVGFANATPEAFSAAIEEGTDVPPTVLRDTLALFSNGSVALLAYNEQTASTETEQVKDAADAAGVPIVSFTETLPEGTDYVSWMSENLAAIAAALAP